MSQNRLRKHAVNDWTRGIARFGPAAVVTKIHMPQKKQKRNKTAHCFSIIFTKVKMPCSSCCFCYSISMIMMIQARKMWWFADWLWLHGRGAGVGWGGVLETAHTGNRCVRRLCVCHIELLCIPLIVWSGFSLFFFPCKTYHLVYLCLQLQ